MTRPKPRVLLESPRGFRTDQVLAAEAVHILVYQNRPVNLRTLHRLSSKVVYPKTTSVHRARIAALAARLNKLYNTTDFAVLTIKE